MSSRRKKAAGQSRPKKVVSQKPNANHPGDRTESVSPGLPSSTPEIPAVTAFPIVGIGASAGGLEAYTELLKHLPTDTGMGFVLVQHLDPLHESALTQLLGRATRMPVREITEELRVQPNHVYVIPPNTTLGIVQGVLNLVLRPASRTVTRSIDSFFEALAQDRRERAIGVVLSGTASDGTLGLEAIKAEGGITFAQDDSARYDSMPRSAAAAGCVDFVLAPAEIAQELARIAKHPYVARPPKTEESTPEVDRAQATEHEDDDTPLPSGGAGSPAIRLESARAEAETRTAGAGDNGYKKILLLLRNHCGVDFSLYKSTTIQRRIGRRMVLNRQDTLEDYARFLRGNAKELDALYSDVLISVTNFFRNPEAFDVLQRAVFPKLLQRRGNDPFRVWVLGCSTGQEAYSIAMAFVEATENSPRLRKLQIFATDLNNVLLDKARHGLYAKTLVEDLSPERLRRFFVEEDGGYRVVKSLREMVVFARQNLIGDPPFSRMDLISCRNLLIYLEPDLQKKAMPTFHYALKPEGFLFLGASESVGGFTELFEPVDKKHKIFARKTAPTPAHHLPLKKERGAMESAPRRAPAGARVKADAPAIEGLRGELSAQREADRVTVNRFAPPGVLINAEFQILQFRGSTRGYLGPPPAGKATFDVLKMAREGLMLPLRAAINKAKKENKTARKENVIIKENGRTRTVNLEVVPLKNLRERCFLVFFDDAERMERAVLEATTREPLGDPARTDRPASKKEASRRVGALERELIETRDFLQSIQEQHEAANEELQASNEEVTSANEELQSVNEELETSKEELESSNEELTTVNEEMANRNTELNRLNSDLLNLQTSTKLAIVLIGRDLTIRRFSPQAEKLFNLLATDAGRPIGNLRHTLDLTNLDALVTEVITGVRETEREVRDKEGRWYSLRVRPYLTLDNKVDGAVLVLVEITALKRSEREAQAARGYAEATLRTMRDPMIVLHADLRVNTANDAFYRTFRVTQEKIEGRSLFEVSGGAWDIPQLRTLLEEILPAKSVFNDYELRHDFPGIGRRSMLLNARRLIGGDDLPPMILLAIEDMTERQETQRARFFSEIRYRRLFETANDGVLILDNKSRKITDANPFMTELLGYAREEFVGKELWEIGLLKDEQASHAAIRELQDRRQIRYEHLPLQTKSGVPREVEFIANRYDEGGRQVIQCNIRDITARSRTEFQVEAQRQALQLLAEGASLDDVLGYLIGVVERKSPDQMLASIALLNDAGTRFQRGIGASLPAAFHAGVEGVEVSSPSDLRAFAARRLEGTAVPDFNADPAWQTFGQFVAPYGVRAGWSTPIISSTGQVLGTFSNYYLQPGDPTPKNRELVDVVIRTAAIAIERRRAEEERSASEAWHRLLFDSVKDFAIFSMDQQGRVTNWNPGAERLFGYASEEIAGQNVSILFTPEDQAAGVPELELRTAEGESFALDDRWHLRKNGERFFVSGAMRPLRDDAGKLLGFVKIVRDITERKHAEEALRSAQAQLADRAGQLEQAVTERTAELSATNEQLESFVYTVAHDLRGPLRAMEGFSALLVEEAGTGLSETARDFARRIRSSAHFMDSLLRDLLVFSRLSQQRVVLAPLDLDSVVRTALSRLEREIQKGSARVETPGPWQPVLAHESTVGQMLYNLLSNALKFVRPETPPLIHVRTEERDRFVRVWVEDNGLGIAAEHHQQVFRLFTRLHGEKYSGTGIGLTIVQKGAERMGGQAGVESIPGQGSRFWFELRKV